MLDADTNDFLYQWAASGDYDPSSRLGGVKAHVLVINSADDERNPLSTGILETAMKQVKNGRTFIIPASANTAGHGTTGGMAKLYAAEVAKFMAELPKR